MHAEDVAYLAGLFEGEGTVYTELHYWNGRHERRLRLTPQFKLRINMTDLEPLQRVQVAFGGRMHGPYRYGPAHHKPKWIWDADGKLAHTIAAAIYPMLSPRRQAQIDAGTAHRKAVA